MADEKRDDDKHKAEKAEDLTPTPTQAELDKIMADLTGTEVQKKPAPRQDKDAEDLTPHMTQAENDAAIKAARPGDVPPEGSTDPQDKKNKELEADKPVAAGYQTRSTKPVR